MNRLTLTAAERIPLWAWVCLGDAPLSVRLCRSERDRPIGIATGVFAEVSPNPRKPTHFEEGDIILIDLPIQCGTSVASGRVGYGDYIIPSLADGLCVSIGRYSRNKYVAGISMDDAENGDKFNILIWPQWIGETP